MLYLLRRFAFVASLSMLLAGPFPGQFGEASAQAVTQVGGTGVGLVPPKGMVPAKGFSGFESPATGGSILVAEFPPEAYDQIVGTFTAEGMKASGLEVSGTPVDWKIAGGQGGRLVRGKQEAHGTMFRKWVVLAKGPGSTVMLSVQVPDKKPGNLTDAVVEGSLKTIALRAPPSNDDQAAALPFKVGDRQGFRLVRVLAGSGLLLTDGPRDTIPDASQPVVIVASSLAPVTMKDDSERKLLATKSFESVAGVSDSSTVSDTIEEKDGVVWSRIEGRGTYRESMEAVSLLQIMRFEKNGYVRVVGITRTLGKERVLARIDALAASIAPK